MTTWRMRIVCWIPRATDAHSGCVILFVFPVQQWLHERALSRGHTILTSRELT
jgi:hypothetical protein